MVDGNNIQLQIQLNFPGSLSSLGTEVALIVGQTAPRL
jgi:hypothetical protein